MASCVLMPILGMLLPLNLHLPFMSRPVPAGAEAVIEIPQVEGIDTTVQSVSGNWWQELSIHQIVVGVWLLGIIIYTVILAVRLVSLYKILRGSRYLYRHDGIEVKLLQGKGIISPFSTLGKIFLSPHSQDSDMMQNILIHEAAHVRGFHFIDVCCSELFRIANWYNPLAHLLINNQKENLEYLADRDVINSCTDKKKYQYQLLTMTMSNQPHMPLCSAYNDVQNLKNRIEMMNKKASRSITKLGYLAIIPMGALLITAGNLFLAKAEPVQAPMSMTENIFPDVSVETLTSANENPLLQIQTPQDDKVYTVVEQLPSFPGGQAALMKYLAKNIQYPADAQKKNIQGKVVVTFIVNKDGSLSDINIARGVDTSLDKEALRVIEGMPKWKPGKQKGEIVRCKFALPVVYKLNNTKQEKVFKDATAKTKSDGVFEAVDEQPLFPGGTGEMYKFMANTMIYPETAIKANIQGKVIVRYIVNQDGSISDIEVARGVDPVLDAEAVRVIKAMPKWIPGKQNGKPVRVRYTMPVVFMLNKK
ncbi:M56 family metallopeptidase [Porphyromonas pogonae]|uniref:M56 family metallopeptidase n=2 Tax=Porphyromonas pogonae TaxID=867595 RepID=UPI00300EF4C9